MSITPSENEEVEGGLVKEDRGADHVKAWVSRTLAGMDGEEDDDEEALAFLWFLPSAGVLGSGSGGHGAATAPAARLFAPVFNYKAAYNTATEEVDQLRQEVAELKVSCTLLRQGRDLAVVAAEAATARCIELETDLAEAHGAWQRKLDEF